MVEKDFHLYSTHSGIEIYLSEGPLFLRDDFGGFIKEIISKHFHHNIFREDWIFRLKYCWGEYPEIY